ncbi:MAG TPA: hypothetical protein VHO95_06710 [Candidatus Dormibacteraeota bacterium]|jgi:hypothetical protein|nr:hypothetical protein [Candidatus Dormibacteraeota bacterium]
MSDPLHSRVVCTILNTSAHLFSGDTFVYLRTVSPTETDVELHRYPGGATQVWLSTQNRTRLLYT